MDIIVPSGTPPHGKPFEPRPLVTARRARDGSHEVTIQPGADVTDVVVTLRDLPAEAFFTEHHGDVDVMLVFRPIPPAGATAAAPHPDGPDDGAPGAAQTPEATAARRELVAA